MIRRCFLAGWILTFSTVALQPTQYALSGQMVTFEPVIKTHPDEILWKHNGNKVVEFNGNEETVYNPFEKRITLDWQGAVLKIKQLRHDDSGKYELDVLTNKGLDRFYFALEIIDRVAKPNISCKMNNGSSGSDKSGNEATLTCSADSSQPQSFEWSQHGNTHPGPIFKILLGKEYDDEVYNCTVSNRLSKEMATFTAKDCYLVNRSAGLSAGLSATIGLIVALCVLGALCVLYCKLKHKACFAKEKTNDVEQQPSLNEANDHASKPLLERLSTIPSTQRLRPLPGMMGNKNCNQNDEDTESDEDTGIVRRLTRKFEQSQVPTALENSEDKLKKTQPPVAEKPTFNGNAQNVKGETDADPHREEPEKTVLAVDHLEDHSGATQHDQQPFSASELPDLEHSKHEHKKPGPSANHLESEKEEDEEAPNMAPADEHKEEKQDAITDQVTGETKEENENKKEENDSDVLREKDESPTTDEQTGLENNKDKSKKPPPIVPRKAFKKNKEQAAVNALRENKVSERDGLKEHSGAIESDLQSSTASEMPGSESNTDKSKKTKPPVPKKSPSFRIIKGQDAVNALRENKVSERDGLKEHSGATESDLQSSTASETPESGKEEDEEAPNMVSADEHKEEKQDAIADQVTGESKEENENEKEENDSDDLREKKKSTDEHTELEKEKEEDEKAPNMAPADEHKEENQEAIADQVTRETKEENGKKKEENDSDDLREKEKLPTTHEQTGSESNKDKSKKTKPPVPQKSPLFKIIQGQADVNALRENKVSERDGLKELSGATESDLQSSTASETPGSESNTDKSKKTKPPVPKKSPSFRIIKGQDAVNALRENKVSERDGLKEHSGAIESDLQSSTASETPGLENNKDKSKKPPPIVPRKAFKKNKEQAAVNALRENKVSERDGLKEHSGATESDLQSSTASEMPELEKEADDKAKSAPEVGGSPSAAEPLTQASPKMAPKNDAGERVDDSNSEQVTGETNEENAGK